MICRGLFWGLTASMLAARTLVPGMRTRAAQASYATFTDLSRLCVTIVSRWRSSLRCRLDLNLLLERLCTRVDAAAPDARRSAAMRAAVGSLLIALAVGLPAAAGKTAGAAASLTLSIQVTYGSGTGAIASPTAVCDVGTDGAAMARVSDRIGDLSHPAWSREGTKLAFAAYDRKTRRYSIQVTPASSWRPMIVARSGARLANPTWSPDGTRIAYSSESATARGIYAVGADGSRNVRLYAGAALAPAWSPDGSTIAFAAGIVSHGIEYMREIKLMRPDGSEVRTISEDSFDGGVTWSPDGRRLAFVASPTVSSGEELFTTDADGGGKSQLSHLSLGVGGSNPSLGAPAWSPDGTTIAVVRTRSHFGFHSFYQEQDLFLLDRTSGAGPSVKLQLAAVARAASQGQADLNISDLTWHPAAAPSTADAARRPCAIFAGPGDAHVRGTAYDDLIVTGPGNDSIDGGAGNDWIEAGAGNDRIVGGSGRDEIWSGPGRDVELVRDRERDLVHCGDFPRDIVYADRRDGVTGRCKAIRRR
jgi:dipeptidyl aminopeptidase/acylaminoacyl peptidase